MAATPNIDFTARDWDTNLQALEDYIRTNFPSTWNSLFEGDLGTALLEAIAYDFSILSYIVDMQTQECFLDTLQLRQSLLHFARLTGYSVKRASPASIDVMAEVTNPPSSGSSYIITKGTEIRSKDGQIWEVADDHEITANNFTPVVDVLSYVDVKAGQDSLGNTVFAYLKIAAGTSMAVLCDKLGNRLPSNINFGSTVGQGYILRLPNFLDQDGNISGAPDINHDAFAIIEVSQLSQDLYQNTVLFLDRAWDQTTDFIGTWDIQNQNITLVQGKSYSETFTTPTTADDRKNFSVQATYYPVIGDASQTPIPAGFFGNATTGNTTGIGVSVTVNGIAWTATASLLFETGDAFVYEVDTDEFDRLTIKFGDGVFGALVPSDAQVAISYRVGGGAAGNLPPASFDTNIVAQNLADASQPVTVYITNPYTVGSGGQERETLQQAKKSIPQFVRTNDRAVTVEDYAYLASNFTDPVAGRIKLAKGVLHTNNVPREQNIVWVYAWVLGATGQLATPSLTLKSRLLDYLNDRKMITDEVVIVDGQTTIVPLAIRYRYSKSADASVVAGNLQVALNSVFVALKPGDTLYLSALYEAIASVPDLDFVNILQPTDNFVPENQFDLFSNTLQILQPTKLLTPAGSGATQVIVASTANFSPKQRIMLYESGKTPTVGIVDSVQTGGVINLRSDTPLADSYSTDADVVPSDYLPYGWAYERQTDLFVRFTSGSGVTQATTGAVAAKIKDYFNKTLRPEEALSKTRLEAMIRGIPNVITATVNFNSIDNPIEQIVPSTREKVTLGVLTINSKQI